MEAARAYAPPSPKSDGQQGRNTRQRLWLALVFPHFPLETGCRGVAGHEPVAVVEGQGTRARILACNQAARKAGVSIGMPLSAAWAVATGLQTVSQNTAVEAAALRGIAAWAGQWSSLVSLVEDRPYGLLLEVGGSLRLFGDLEELTTRIRAGVEELGYRARLGVAPTPLAAWLLARINDRRPVRQCETLAGRLAPVPLFFLGLEKNTYKALGNMGVRSFGDCQRLSRGGAARRLGPELVHYLDRALGRAADPRPAYVTPAVFMQELELLAETSALDALRFAARRLLLELEGFLIARDGAVGNLELGLRHRRQADTCIAIRLLVPGRNARHLLALLRQRLEGIQLPAPVTGLWLRVDKVLVSAPSATDLFGSVEQREEEQQLLVECLQARLGVDAVQGLERLPGHRPERVWRYCAPGTKSPAAKSEMTAPRPLWLLACPRILQHMPRIESGPERIQSGWWDGEDIVRDYYTARTSEGVQLWVFRELRGEQRWFIHGYFA